MATAPPLLRFDSQAEWSAWLAEHHADTPAGVELAFLRKRAGEGLTHNQALEEALRYGWIDGRTGRGDETHWRQRFHPRRARSVWSQVNVAKAEALIAAGRMTPAGQAEVDRARADGRWAAAYAPPSRSEVPDDLAAALAANPAAQAAFEGLDSRNRFAILYRTGQTKKPETRARRIETFVAMLSRGEVIHPRGK
jgi:uncharacterized protein YdeI (YjbR/CyaY-like superfamily)